MSTDTTRTAAVTKLLYTPLEAAAALGVGRSTLYLLLADGEVASVRIGALRRIPAAALDDYVARLESTRSSQTQSTIGVTRSPGTRRTAAIATATLEKGTPMARRRREPTRPLQP
jgi:excisionase family DNA binding protein